MKDLRKRLSELRVQTIWPGWAGRDWPKSYFGAAFGRDSRCSCTKLRLSINSTTNRSSRHLQNFSPLEWLRSLETFPQSCGPQTRKRLRKPIRYEPPSKKSRDEPQRPC